MARLLTVFFFTAIILAVTFKDFATCQSHDIDVSQLPDDNGEIEPMDEPNGGENGAFENLNAGMDADEISMGR
ncbi:hypothetical protein DdX_08467 [Ditylenchus destructor]|uniref:Uncharacterized protein n=1 Tax=Ditylenchus destructor TaxID=166010 RepID=A0AAD4N169_9BILA|nr:hypothetical protein DdX_08467 [Ditylenchus destructor]